MSGIEVVGLILGALPLVISAIEHYESNLDRAVAFFKWKDELEKAMRELNLLLDVASNSELEEMMSDAQSPLWKSGELADALQHKLGVAYKLYMHIVKEMETHLKTLASHLDIDRQDVRLQGTANELEAIIITARTFTMKRKDVRRLLAELKECNDRLEQFIEKAQKFEQPSAQATTSKPHLSTPLQKISEYATSLHHVLLQAWCCTSHSRHHAHLLLEHRMIKRRKRRQLKAKFLVVTPTAIAQSNCVPPVSQLDPAELEVVHNLCSIFERQQKNGSYLGFGLDSKGLLRGTFQPSKAAPSFAESLVSLEDLLFSRSKPWQPATDEERYILAITLVSSLLQLHSTPWLAAHWSERDILFPEIAGESRRIDFRHPFVMKTYAEDHINERAESSTVTTATAKSLDENKNLLTLAKILLEIRLNSRMVDWRQKQDLGAGMLPNAARELQNLKEWISQEEGNLSFAFKDAVGYCMKCFADPGTNLRDPLFRQGVIDSVVVPLVEELHYWQEGCITTD
ncbi:hypothetical protein QBC46DRAFT_460845 [Diplogelasinospora grovesii]|uniref:DUF7580 domain-containing protein n=1 Tax=Diplogelasinospora grovesii TaxID=303347 RepID=A0AAN6N1L6_9PEZI|nr:hypothetical protein QBC46DRAFT_460845 [Diplogelasinospora grovesii]